MELSGKAAKQYRVDLVVKLHKEGQTQVQIAQTVGLSQGRVSQIVRRYQDGEERVLVKSPPGLTAGLGSAQLSELRELLMAEAKASGFTSDGWTLKRVGQLINHHYGIDYSLEHVRRILHKIGFTRQRPQARDYRQDEEAVKRWTSETLPSLKKS